MYLRNPDSTQAVPNFHGLNSHSTGILVWSVWAAMLAAAVGYVAAFGLMMPFADEWAWIGISTGHQSPNFEWFWSSHNGHRMLIPRLIYITTGSLTGYQFNIMALANVATLGAAAAVLMRAARRVRGRSDVTDIIFPAAFLHWGHEINLTWCFQMNYVTSTLLAAVALGMLVQCQNGISSLQAGVLSFVLCCMSLCGLFGLVMVPPIAVWLLVATLWSWKAGKLTSPGAVFHAACGLLPLVLAALCLIGLPPQSNGLTSPGILATLDTTLKFLTTSVGPLGRALRPVGPWLVVLVVMATLGRLTIVWYREPQERLRIAGLVSFLLSVGLLAGAIGWGRAGIGPNAGYANRYGILAVPLVCGVFFAWTIYGVMNLSRQAVVACLVLSLVLVLVNDRKGFRDGQKRDRWMTQLQQAAERGASQEKIAHDFHANAHIGERSFVGALEALRVSERGPYAVRR